MKKLIGIFDTKTMTPEQIFNRVKESLEKQKFSKEVKGSKKLEKVKDDLNE